MRRPRAVHPIPLMCRIFGHYWHNEHARYTFLGTDRCLRGDCPGDGHVWDHSHVVDNIAHDRCTYPNCGATSTWQIPNMSLLPLPRQELGTHAMKQREGTVLEVAGKPYVWMRNEDGVLETVPFAKVQVAMADIIAQAKEADHG